jgi:hypothetical protein
MEMKSHDPKMAPTGGSRDGPLKSESQQSIVSRPENEYVVYKRRWYIVVVIVVLNLSNAMVSCRFSSKYKSMLSVGSGELKVKWKSEQKTSRSRLSVFTYHNACSWIDDILFILKHVYHTDRIARSDRRWSDSWNNLCLGTGLNRIRRTFIG